MENNFAKYIIDINQHNLNKIALVDEFSQLTYEQMSFGIKCFAKYLKNSGVLPQDRVIISLEDCIEWPVAFLSVLAVGGNPVLVSRDLPDILVDNIVKIADAKFIIGRRIDNCKFFTKEEILSQTQPINSFYQYHPDEMCFWLLSSGTTGEPKCVVHRHQDLQKLLEIIAWPAYCINSNSKILSTAKLSFTYGFNNSLTFGLGTGATVYLINGKPAPKKIFKLIKKNSITHFFTVPTNIISMIKHGKEQILSSVQVMVSSGESLPISIIEIFKTKYNLDILDGLGMSECMYNYCTTILNDNEKGTIGKPLPGIKCEVRDNNNLLVPVGQVGEMWVQHPCAAIQYWKDWEKTKSTFIGTWIKTGDNVFKNSKGNYIYVGRNDELIKINGQYVSPSEIENAIISMNPSYECGVISVKNKNGMNEIHAFVSASVSKSHKILTREIRQYLRNILPTHKIPKFFYFVKCLPKTITGKKKRLELKKSALLLDN